MKNVNSLQQITHMYLDFSTPKGIKITPSYKKNQKNREKQEKEGKRVKEKRTDVSFNRYIDSPLEIEKKLE